MRNTLLLVSLSVFIAGPLSCGFVQPGTPPLPSINYETHQKWEESELPTPENWWTLFKSQALNSHVNKVLAANPSLLQAWHRLRQANAQSSGVAAGLYPQVQTSVTALESDNPGLFQNQGAGGAQFQQPIPNQEENQGGGSSVLYLGNTGITYELDIWGKIYAQQRGASLQAEAAMMTLYATALTLASETTRTWIDFVFTSELKSLLKDQIAAARTQLEIMELRFLNGGTDYLAVLQQKQQLQAVEAELPQVEETRMQRCHRLFTLQGDFPGLCPRTVTLPELPPPPGKVSFAEIVSKRPDLSAIEKQIKAADFQVAALIADRLPTISISLSFQTFTNSIKKIADDTIRQLSSRLSLPVIDGGLRRSRVREQESRLDELLSSYMEQLLIAATEIENALVSEKQLMSLVKLRTTVVETSRNTLTVSKDRYYNGLSSYLDVITALSSLQTNERLLLQAQQLLFRNRVNLYSALGGRVSPLIQKDVKHDET